MRRTLAVFLVVAAALTGIVAGQAQSSTADLSGVVSDQSGAVLPGAEVSATNAQTGFLRTTVSGEDGVYRMPLLPPGPYDVRARLPGFAPKVYQGVNLSVGQYGSLDLILEVSDTQTEIVVRAASAIVETQKTVQASTINEMEIDNLPINGRNFLDFTLLTPGVTDQHTFVTEAAVQTPTSGLSFAGQDQRSNYVTIDGADNVDVISNSVRSTLSQEAIQEFQIARNTFSAEFGRARGGMINIVSKSGTNAFHGTGFFFFRNNSLDARNTFAFGPAGAPVDPEFERYQYGGTIGGPLVRDRTFFFASYEGLDRNESVFVTFLDDNSIFQPMASQLQLFNFLASTGVPSLGALATAFIGTQAGALRTLPTNFPRTVQLFERESGTFPFQADSDTLSFKLDHQISGSNQMFFRANFTDSFNDNANFGALEGVSNGVQFDTRDLALVFSDTHIFSPSTLNDFKFQYARREFSVPTNDPVGPEVVIAGVAEFGREFFNPSGYTQDVFQFTDNMTFIRGSHSLKTGFDFNAMDLRGFAEVFLGGQFSFGEAVPLAAVLNGRLGPGAAAGLIQQLSTPVAAGGLGRPDLAANVLAPISAVQSFNFGLPITYFQGFGDPTADINYYQLAVYVQDSWQIRPNFTLNYGLRLDTDWKPETQNVISTTAPFNFELASLSDRNNVAPRLGLAWDPTNQGRTVVRAGYGLYYQNFFQAVAFVSQVLSGQISQVFLPLTGLPGIPVTSADIWRYIQTTGGTGEQALEFFGITPGTTPSVILPSAGDVVNPYSHHASFGIEQALGNDWSISLDYILNRGAHVIRSRDINVRQVGPDQFALPGLDLRFVQVNLIETSGSSIYHGFTAFLRKRFSRRYAANVAYTLGKAIDDATDFITQLQPSNQRNLAAERSLSSFDQRQRLVVSGVFQSPYQSSSTVGFVGKLLADWTVAPIITWSSGKPFNLLTGFDLNGDTHEETDRPRLADGTTVGRNTGTGPNLFTTDLRVARKFHFPREATNLEFIFEAFNLFNNVNYSGVNNVVGNLALTSADVEGSPNIPANQPLGFTSAFDPRQIQFGFRFNF